MYFLLVKDFKSKRLLSNTPSKLQKIVSTIWSIKLMHSLQENPKCLSETYTSAWLLRFCVSRVYTLGTVQHVRICSSVCVRRPLLNRGLPRRCWDLGTPLQWGTACRGSVWRHMSSEGWVRGPRLPISSSAGYNSPLMPAVLVGYLTNMKQQCKACRNF